jgi:hypothetical protein
MRWSGKKGSEQGKGRDPMENKPAAPPPTQVQVQIDPPEAEGIYSNFVLLNHTPSEIILDFARMLPGPTPPRAKVHARIVLTPHNAVLFMNALKTRLEAYEAQFGKIPTFGEPSTSRDIGFKTETP